MFVMARSRSATNVFAAVCMTAALVVLFSSTLHAQRAPATEPAASNPVQLSAALTPEGTLIVANRADAALCREYSPLLKNLRAGWLVLEEAGLPASAQQKDMLLIAALDSDYTGPLLDELLSAAEIAELRERGGRAVFEKPSPWQAGQIVIIAAGVDSVSAKEAAEEAAAAIMESAASGAIWYAPAEHAPVAEAVAALSERQHVPTGAPLQSAELALDPKAKPPQTLSQEEAAADVEWFFRLLESGWGGYGSYERQGDFARAREAALAQLVQEASWTPTELAGLLRDTLFFVHDCHLSVGDEQFCVHETFWYDDSLAVRLESDGYHFTTDGRDYRIAAINGRAPEGALFPSLNDAGEPIYRLGALAREQPGPVQVAAFGPVGEEYFQLYLANDPYPFRELFGVERVGGIPVIRARTFADSYAEQLEVFLQTARMFQGEPYLILDIRGNGGGNTAWARKWITRFTGHNPSQKQVSSELVSPTTLMGRANIFAEMLARNPSSDPRRLEGQRDFFQESAREMERSNQAPYWTPVNYPGFQIIPNDTTLIVIADQRVGSAGEGLISFLFQQVENVLLVGENSSGALTFGQMSAHQLPSSRLPVYLPVELSLSLDLEMREERGFYPDLWLPPARALNMVVAAIRTGVITTRAAVPAGYFAAPFEPETPQGPTFLDEHPEIAPLGLLLIIFIGAVWTLRSRPFIVLLIGAGWVVISLALVISRHPEGYVLLLLGIVLAAAGLVCCRRETLAV